MDAVIFLLDGCRADALERARADNILGLAKKGAVARRCVTVYPSLTGPGHLSILTGAYPERTGIVGHFYWDSKARELHDIFSDRYCMVKTVFELLSEHGMRGISLGAYMRRGSSDGITRKAMKKAASWISGRRAIMNVLDRSPGTYKFLRGFVVGRYSEFKQAFERGEENLYYVAFNEVDKAGHRHGPESPEYYEAIRECDGKVGEAVQMADEMGRDLLLVITSDHGQTTIRERLGMELLALDEVGYGMDADEDVSGARIITYNAGKDDMAVAAVVSRHVQIWLSKPEDAGAIGKQLGKREGIEHLKLKAEADGDRLNHERLGDVSFSLAQGCGFDFLPICEGGDHGGIDPADMDVPLIFYRNGMRPADIPIASTTDIVPTILHCLGITPPEHVQGKALFNFHRGD